MIYKLDTDFTKIEEKEGLMQNMSYKAFIEVVSCVEDPRKDSGIILQPLEKLNFKARDDESLFARSAHIDGTNANLSVVNFNMPVSGNETGAGYGLTMDVLYSGLAANVGTYNFAKPADSYKMLLVTTSGHQCQQILPMGSASGRFLKMFANTTYQINIQLEAYVDYFKIISSYVGTGWGFTGIETIYGIK